MIRRLVVKTLSFICWVADWKYTPWPISRLGCGGYGLANKVFEWEEKRARRG